MPAVQLRQRINQLVGPGLQRVRRGLEEDPEQLLFTRAFPELVEKGPEVLKPAGRLAFKGLGGFFGLQNLDPATQRRLQTQATPQQKQRGMAFAGLALTGSVTPVSKIPGFGPAKKLISPEEAQNFRDLSAGKPVKELFAAGRGRGLQQAGQRVAGRELLADFDNAMNAGDLTLARRIANAMAKLPQYKEHLGAVFSILGKATGTIDLSGF